jgi:methionine sulfoxide reductase heme-binding subunit
MKEKRPLSLLQLLVHLLAWVPLLLLLWDYWQGQLGLNPIRAITLRTGKTALVLLLLSLTVTPLVIFTGKAWLYRLRRPLGLYAFLYATLHLLTFVGLDYGFDWELVAEAMRSNRFIFAGLASLLIMVPLALTSPHAVRLKMGNQRWRKLHRWTYLAAILAIIHYALLVRQYYTQPIIFGSILFVLLAIRLVNALAKRRRLA